MCDICIKCGSFCANENPMDNFGNKIWCNFCNHYTKTLTILWDFPDSNLIIIANYTKTDQIETYSLDEEVPLYQKRTGFEKTWR